jgi:hypothetical protein
MEQGYRGAGAILERVAALEDENDALRKRNDELEEAARNDERHVLLRRAEKERDQLREQLAAYRAKRDAEEAARIESEVQHRASETQRALDVARARSIELATENATLHERIRELDDFDPEKVRAVRVERDALREEVDALRANARGENETAYVRRLAEERDELLAEVRRLRARR